MWYRACGRALQLSFRGALLLSCGRQLRARGFEGKNARFRNVIPTMTLRDTGTSRSGKLTSLPSRARTQPRCRLCGAGWSCRALLVDRLGRFDVRLHLAAISHLLGGDLTGIRKRQHAGELVGALRQYRLGLTFSLVRILLRLTRMATGDHTSSIAHGWTESAGSSRDLPSCANQDGRHLRRP